MTTFDLCPVLTIRTDDLISSTTRHLNTVVAASEKLAGKEEIV